MLSRAAKKVSPAPRSFAASLLIGLLVSSAAGAAGIAYRVKDLAPGPPTTVPRGFALTPLASTGAWALATGEPGIPSETGEPWLTDGTGAGTRLLRELTPGWTESDVSDGVAVGDGIFFTASSPGTGAELWRTDGTNAGTRLVADLRPGRGGSAPRRVGVLGADYLFAADDGVHGCELWKSDGTAAGTQLVADLRPGGASGLDACATGRAEAGWFASRLYFAADDGVHGRELWRTDGHPAGTYLLKSLVAGPGGGAPADFIAAASRIFFTGSDGAHGRELWASDGSAAGTAQVADLRPGAASSATSPLGRVPDLLVFAADDGVAGRALWVSDGKANGTWRIADVEPDSVGAASLGARLVFAASDAAHGSEPWVTDGTSAGTHRIADLVAGAWGSGPRGFAPVSGRIVFGAGHTEFGDASLWATDGTAAGTVLLAEAGDADSGLEVSAAKPVAGGAVLAVGRYFTPGPYVDYSLDLWATDGTPTGTVRVEGTALVGFSSEPYRLTARDAGIVFAANNIVIYHSDGSEAGTLPLDYPDVGELWDFTEAERLSDGELVFSAVHSEFGTGLFRTDGGEAWPVRLGTDGFPEHLTRSGDLVFFVQDVPGAHELWRTDGTAGGTFEVGEFDNLFGIADAFGTAWFRASRGQIAWSLWESAGTAATTFEHPLAGIEFFDRHPLAIVPLDPARDAFTFQADDGLYLFDPPAQAATRFHASLRASSGSDLAVLGAELHYFDEEPDGSCTLWRSDGTAAGSARVKTWAAGGCIASQLAAMGGRLYFAACNQSAGCELWRSDGTAAGTVLVKDIDPGMFSSMPAALTAAGARLYFIACDGGAGCEPWVTDGTAPGTHRVRDILPGPASSVQPEFDPDQFAGLPNLTAWERLVFLAADDGTGSELWAMPVEIFFDGFESGSTARW